MGRDDAMDQVLAFLTHAREKETVEGEVHLVERHDRLGQRMEPIAEIVDELQFVIGVEIVFVQNAELDDRLDYGLEQLVGVFLAARVAAD